MKFSSLREIDGVGKRVAEKLRKHFGSEEEALRVINNLEFSKLLKIGLPKQKVVEITRNVYSKINNFEYINLMKTQEAKEIYLRILSLVKEHAITEYGKLKLSLFYPTKDKNELKKRFSLVKKALEFYASVDSDKIKEYLRKVKPLEENPKLKRIVDEVVATDSREVYERLKENRDMIDVLLIETQEDIAFLRDFKFVRFVNYDNKFDLQRFLPNVVEVSEEEAIPEKILSFFSANSQSIIASCEIGKLTENKDKKELDEIIENVKKLNSREYDRFSYAVENLHVTIEKCLENANDEIMKEVEASKIAIKGKELLDLISSKTLKLPDKVLLLISEIARKWERNCEKMLKIEEKGIFSGLFRDEAYPLEIDMEKLNEIERFLEYERKIREFKFKNDIAYLLQKYRNKIERIVSDALEIDVLIALAEFSMEYNAIIPEISDKLGIGFINARNIELVRKGEEVQAISYEIGEAIKIKGSKGERVAIITGANSGGKTSLLETIAQIQIATQSGLPVLAEKARVSLLDELYYYKQMRGTLEAGAFETLLKSFASIARSKKRKLVLADEIEAATEPGAAAMIIDALLKCFYEQENTLLALVTHLGREITFSKVRIDGIEAKGLDENLNLIVDRNPVLNRLARSTPELILEKLSKTEKKDREFYEGIIKEFKKNRG